MKKVILFGSVFISIIFLSACFPTEIHAICPTDSIGVGEEIGLDFTTHPAHRREGFEVVLESLDNLIATVDSENVILGVAPGVVKIKMRQVNSNDGRYESYCYITVVAKDILNDDVFDELADIITEPATMDLTDNAYLSYELSGYNTEYEFYYMQLNIDNDTYIIEYALKDAGESIYETGSLSDASGSYEIERLNQPSGFDEFWGFDLVGVNMELYILYYYDDGNFVVDEFDSMIFVPIGNE